jgi:hypothetical protein
LPGSYLWLLPNKERKEGFLIGKERLFLSLPGLLIYLPGSFIWLLPDEERKEGFLIGREHFLISLLGLFVSLVVQDQYLRKTVIFRHRSKDRGVGIFVGS